MEAQNRLLDDASDIKLGDGGDTDGYKPYSSDEPNSKAPMPGEDWDNYFKEAYGDDAVTRETPTKSLLGDDLNEVPQTKVQPPALPEVAVPSSNEGAGKAVVDNPFDETGKLKPDVKYKAGEFDYNYETDSMGRIEKFTTDDLKLTERTDRLPHNANTPGKIDGDHAGHLAGDRFGGSPEIDNLVSQSSNANLSTYKKIENQCAKAIEQGKIVRVEVNIKYDGNSLRPTEFNVKYSIDNVEKIMDISN